MIKAVLLKKTGGIDALEITNVSPRKPNRDEAIVKNTVIGVNYLDIEQRKGNYKLDLPAIPGCEAVGIIQELGEGATSDFKVGDKVCYCTVPYGAYAEKRVINIKNLIKIPAQLNSEIIAASMYKGMLTFLLISRAYIVREGITIMIHNPTNDVGRILCQWIKTRKAKIIGTVDSENKISEAANLGCDLVLNYKQHSVKELIKQVADFTNGYGVSAVYDSVGRDTYLLSINSLCIFGIYILYEQRSGSIPAMNWKAFRARSLFFTYPSIFHYERTQVEFVLTAAEVLKFIQDKKIVPHIAKRYNFTDIKEAHSDMETGILEGSAIVIL